MQAGEGVGLAFLAAVLVLAGVPPADGQEPAVSPPAVNAPAQAKGETVKEIIWRLDNLQEIGGHKVTVEGAPQVIETGGGKAVLFDGVKDALFLDTDPLAGLRAFTLEAVFRQDAGGAPEQRFLHVQEDGSESRALLETRVTPDGKWYLDTFLKSATADRALASPKFVHPLSEWHSVALVYDGKMMTHYVNARRELAGAVKFPPHGKGRTSLGCRINKIWWFKGAIRLVRVTPRALEAKELIRTDE